MAAPDGSVDLAGKAYNQAGTAKAGLTVELWTATNWEAYQDGTAASTAYTATDTSDADGLWNFDDQDITQTWVVVVREGTKRVLVDGRNEIQLGKLDVISGMSADLIYEHTAAAGVTIDGVLLKDGTVTLVNSGLHVLDTNASHDLIITPGSDLTADRILTLTTGDAARTITLSGNPTLGDWFDQSVKTTANPTFGNLTITSFAANWTNAGRTVADLGVVTTVDINGGTIDGWTSLTGSGVISTTNTTASTSPTTGSGKFAGGVGVAGALYVAGNSSVVAALTADTISFAVENTSAAGASAGAAIRLKLPAASTALSFLAWWQGAASGAADNMNYSLGVNCGGVSGVFPAASWFLYSGDTDGSATAGIVFAVADGTNDMKFYGGIGVSGTAAPTAGIAMGATNLTTTGTISATGARVTQSYHTNITSTNAVTVDSARESKVAETMEAYTADALAVIRDMEVVRFQHLHSLDPSDRFKLGVISETVGEPLALGDIEKADGGSYKGVNVYGLTVVNTAALQALLRRVEALEAA